MRADEEDLLVLSLSISLSLRATQEFKLDATYDVV